MYIVGHDNINIIHAINKKPTSIWIGEYEYENK